MADFSKVKKIIRTTKNLVSARDFKKGYLTVDGAIEITNDRYEGYIIIPVEPNDIFTFSQNHENTGIYDWYGYSFFDNSEINAANMLTRRTDKHLTNSFEGFSTQIKVPNLSNVRYLCLSARHILNVPVPTYTQLEKGTVATQYVPKLREITKVYHDNQIIFEVKK